MNNNNFIPIYLQKFIIKILCNHINKNNKLIESIYYRESELCIKKLTQSISLVNKLWLKTIQKNLEVSIDLNFNDVDDDDDDDDNDDTLLSSFSILKLENIKTLKIHYDHQKQYFYKLKINEIEILSIDRINKNLKLLSNNNRNNNFKRLIIRNINTAAESTLSTSNNGLNILESLYSCNVTNNNIQLLELEINRFTIINQLNRFNDRIKKLYLLSFNLENMDDGFYNQDLMLQVFKNWYRKDVKQLLLISQEIYFPILQILSGTIEYIDKSGKLIKPISIGVGVGGIGDRVNYLENIQFIELVSTEITLDDLLCLSSSSLLPNLINLSIEICFDKLIYFLSTKQEKEKLGNSIRKCNCGCLFQNLFGFDLRDNEIFNGKWNFLLETVKNNKSLNYLKMNHYCKINGVNLLWKKKKFTLSFLENLSEFVSSFKSLTNFSLIASDIFPEIFDETIKKNKKLKHFESKINMIGKRISGNDYYYIYKDEIERLLNTYDHVESFKLVEIDFKNNNYQETILLEYNKNTINSILVDGVFI